MQEKKLDGTIKRFQDQFGSNHETYLGVAVEAMIRERADTFVRKNCMSYTTNELYELRKMTLFYDQLPLPLEEEVPLVQSKKVPSLLVPEGSEPSVDEVASVATWPPPVEPPKPEPIKEVRIKPKVK